MGKGFRAGSGEIILYSTEDGRAQIQLRAEGGTVWLTQAQMAELFATSPQAITQLIRSIYRDGELAEQATCKDILQVRTEGVRQVRRTLKAYSLDAILAVGYRVRSPRGVQFRRWATTVPDLVESTTHYESTRGRDEVEAFLDFWAGRCLEDKTSPRPILGDQFVAHSRGLHGVSEPENRMQDVAVEVVPGRRGTLNLCCRSRAQVKRSVLGTRLLKPQILLDEVQVRYVAKPGRLLCREQWIRAPIQ